MTGTRYRLEDLRHDATLPLESDVDTYALSDEDIGPAVLALVEAVEAANAPGILGGLERIDVYTDGHADRDKLRKALSRFDFSRPGKSATEVTSTTDADASSEKEN